MNYEKKNSALKKFGLNNEVIAKTDAYFKDPKKPFFKKCIDMLENSWTDYIILKGMSNW